EVLAYPPNRPLDEASIRQAAEGCIGIVSQLMDPIRDTVLSTPGLKCVSNVAVGFDNIDLAAATSHKVMVTNTPGVLDDSTSDFISMHVPLAQETHHLFSTQQFHQMKRNAVLVNTSRGPVVDEVALVEALKGRKLAGAGLDVYEREPAVHPGLTPMPNVVLAPHIASATVRTRSEMSAMAARNMATAVRGGRPPNLVNPEVKK